MAAGLGECEVAGRVERRVGHQPQLAEVGACLESPQVGGV
jgi:hypothetical protein